MAKVLTTSATNYFLEELIKDTTERLIIISPYLKFNNRIRLLLEDKNRLKIDVRIVYGKVDLRREEVQWLSGLPYIRTSFLKDLHAKCYLNEKWCVISSMNLYEFSQQNNYELGVAFEKDTDAKLYADAHKEVQLFLRSSEERILTLEKTTPRPQKKIEINKPKKNQQIGNALMLAKKLDNIASKPIGEFISTGYITYEDIKKILQVSHEVKESFNTFEAEKVTPSLIEEFSVAIDLLMKELASKNTLNYAEIINNLRIIDGVKTTLEGVTSKFENAGAPKNIIKGDQRKLSIPKLAKGKKSIDVKQAQNLKDGKPKNAGLPWTQECRGEVSKLFKKGMEINKLASYFERSEGAIRAELMHQGLIE